jgi:hypothetical protein
MKRLNSLDQIINITNHQTSISKNSKQLHSVIFSLRVEEIIKYSKEESHERVANF